MRRTAHRTRGQREARAQLVRSLRRNSIFALWTGTFVLGELVALVLEVAPV